MKKKFPNFSPFFLSLPLHLFSIYCPKDVVETQVTSCHSSAQNPTVSPFGMGKSQSIYGIRQVLHDFSSHLSFQPHWSSYYSLNTPNVLLPQIPYTSCFFCWEPFSLNSCTLASSLPSNLPKGAPALLTLSIISTCSFIILYPHFILYYFSPLITVNTIYFRYSFSFQFPQLLWQVIFFFLNSLLNLQNLEQCV